MACISSQPQRQSRWSSSHESGGRMDLLCHENMSDDEDGVPQQRDTTMRPMAGKIPPPPAAGTAVRVVSSTSSTGIQVQSPELARRKSNRQLGSITTNTGQEQPSLMPMKSPISCCIDTIIGAAEAVAKREEWLAAQGKTKSPSRSLWNMNEHSSQQETAEATSFSHSIEHYTHEEPRDEARDETDLEVALADKTLLKNLVLTMALQRPRQKDKGEVALQSYEAAQPRIIGEGFYWKDYPHLEELLYSHMGEYYEWSTRQRQSKHQQAFNNALVEKVRTVAATHGHAFESEHFTDKRLRDRIRCFFKTHLQNAKKRLHTMQKHLDNQNHRTALQELIRQVRSSGDPASSQNSGLLRTVSYSDCSDDTTFEGEGLRRKRRRS